jgi:hypothetical protein
MASILRTPGTHNRKNPDEPRLVRAGVKLEGPYDKEQFASLLRVPATAGSHHPDCPKHPSQQPQPMSANHLQLMLLASLGTVNKLLNFLSYEESKQNPSGSRVWDLSYIAETVNNLLIAYLQETKSATHSLKPKNGSTDGVIPSPEPQPASISKKSTRKAAKPARTGGKSTARSASVELRGIAQMARLRTNRTTMMS